MEEIVICYHNTISCKSVSVFQSALQTSARQYLIDMKLPLKIDPCPIIDSNVEIRLERKEDIPSDAVFGIVYNVLKIKYPTVKALPILEIPEPIRMHEPKLKYTAHYRLSKDNFILQVGPNLISLGCQQPYVGWKILFPELMDAFKIIHETDIFKKVLRIGIRVINYFGDDIFQNINLEIELIGAMISNKNTIFRTETTDGKFKSTLQIANNANIKSEYQELQGSIIDVDTFYEPQEGEEKKISEIFDYIDKGHLVEKTLFFSLLKEEYLSRNFNPVYE